MSDYLEYTGSLTIEYDMTDRPLNRIPLPIFENPLKKFMGDNFDKLTDLEKKKALNLDLRVAYDWGKE